MFNEISFAKYLYAQYIVMFLYVLKPGVQLFVSFSKLLNLRVHFCVFFTKNSWCSFLCTVLHYGILLFNSVCCSLLWNIVVHFCMLFFIIKPCCSFLPQLSKIRGTSYKAYRVVRCWGSHIVSKSKSHCDWRSVSQYVLCRAQLWDFWP
jgi:hypothetical protein